MAITPVAKNQVLFETDHPVTETFLIVKGSFLISFPGGSYTIGKGEVCGICDLCTDIHYTSCKSLEDSSVLICDVTDIDSLNNLFKTNPDYCMLFIRSAFRQINDLLQQYELSQLATNNLYTTLNQNAIYYLSCCERHKLRPRILPPIADLPSQAEDSGLENWALAYYDGFQQILSGNELNILSKETSVPTGIIARICTDSLKVLSSIKALHNYQKQLTSLLINEELEDYFDFYTCLFLTLGEHASDSDHIRQIIQTIMETVTSTSLINKELYHQRFLDYQESISSLPSVNDEVQVKSSANKPGLSFLKGSLDTILNYAEMDDTFIETFKKLIRTYSNMADKNDTSDEARALRNQITKPFYELYRTIFYRAVEDSNIPNVVRMFLYFGYLDEKLCGEENATYLSHISELLAEEHIEHVYTLFDWLCAIYHGKKEPSRNEFEVDYTDYIHSLKVKGSISVTEEVSLLRDMKKKVDYELTNMVPVVNKMTFGRISTFCPVFSAHNVLKHLDLSYVSGNNLKEAISNVTDLDFRVFYREYVYSNVPIGIQKEFFHTNVYPDILLMPCIGTRGVMWQEIEGHKRTTSARMMLPIFYLEDLQSAVIRLCGEYRWEMCKRVQGAHWNDVSDRSLTSEYFDYIQFYKKNHELSQDAKEKLKTALQKAHNSFKEMFVRDYVTYIFFEGTGSPRLNKPTRNILFTYCPFSLDRRSPLSNNPIYKETLDYFLIKQNQQLHHLDLLTRKIEYSGNPIPKELQEEKRYIES